MTDARGNFAFDALAPGSYTLAFRSRKSNDTPAVTTSKVTVASTYSIKIEGTKRAVNQSGLIGWIAREPGSHIPGHRAEAG